MPRTAKNFCAFFVILALAALGGDIYIWQTSADHPFAFAALGYITKTYAKDYHQMVVDTLTPEVFDQIFTPILAIPGFFLCLGLAALSLILGFVAKIISAARGGTKATKDNAFKYKRR